MVLEDLDVKNMTRSAKDTVEEPGTNVKARSGFDRVIIASGWGQMERKWTYKAGELAKVPAPYTSQTCSHCGHVDPCNRITQARFRCVGFMANADHNAAINILGLHRASVAARPPAQQGPLHSEERCFPALLRMAKALPGPVNKVAGGQTPNQHSPAATQSGPGPGIDQGHLKPEH